VAGAIIASTLTTTVIFLPVIFMQTISGLLFQQLALVVVFALLCSLLVALTLVPMLASRFLSITKSDEQQGSWSFFARLQRFFNRLESKYAVLLRFSLTKSRWVFSITLVLVTASVFLFPQIPVELAPQTDADEIDIDLQMADGTNITVQNYYLQKLEDIVLEVLPTDDVKNVTTEVRDGRAEVEIAMVSVDKRKSKTSEIAEELRQKLEGQIPGADIRVSAQSGLWILRRIFGSGGGTEAVQVQLRGYDIDQSYEIAQRLRLEMERDTWNHWSTR